MKTALGVAVVIGVIGAGGAFAQSGPSTPSVNAPGVLSASPHSKNSAAPVAGKNSFTESEARSRLEAHGYANVTGLTKDDKSIWRGKATKGGAPVNVALDYQGNIVPSK